MAERQGTIIAAEVTAATDDETFAYTDGNRVRGGYHSYATIAERDAITQERRARYAPVYVRDSGDGTPKVYRLIDGLTNADWVADDTDDTPAFAQFDVTANGVATEFTVTHNLGREYLQISFVDVTVPPERPVSIHWEYVSSNAIKLVPDIVLANGRIIRIFIS